MSNLVQPDRLALIVCPDHKGGEFLLLTKADAILKYHVTRMVWRMNGECFTYLYPPVVFVISALEQYQATGGLNQPLGMAEDKCSVCRGFGFPSFKGHI
jgi:hypothetical protein